MKLLHVINWMYDLQLLNLVFELDAKKVDNYLNNDNITEFGVILDEYKHCRNLFFTNSQIEFSRRQANDVTHTLTTETHILR